MAFPVVQAGEGLLQRQLLDPVFVGVVRVLDLIHHADGVAAVGIDRLVQRHGVHNGVHGKYHVLPGDLQILCDLLHGGLALAVLHQLFPCLEHFVCRVAHTAADTDGAVIAQIPADLPYNHGYAVGGKPDRLIDVKIIDGLHQTDTTHLKQVVYIFAAIQKLLHHGQNQTQIAVNQLFPRLCVTILGLTQELRDLIAFQRL